MHMGKLVFAQLMNHLPWKTFGRIVERYCLADRPSWSDALVFIGQFEELFSVAAERHRAPFARLLAAATRSDRIRIIATMRADFYHRCVERHSA